MIVYPSYSTRYDHYPERWQHNLATNLIIAFNLMRMVRDAQRESKKRQHLRELEHFMIKHPSDTRRALDELREYEDLRRRFG